MSATMHDAITHQGTERPARKYSCTERLRRPSHAPNAVIATTYASSTTTADSGSFIGTRDYPTNGPA